MRLIVYDQLATARRSSNSKTAGFEGGGFKRIYDLVLRDLQEASREPGSSASRVEETVLLPRSCLSI